MSDPHALYHEAILDHHRRPRHYGALERATHVGKRHNPFCGDRVTVYLVMDGDRISAVGFEASGCAISIASASMMTQGIEGRTHTEARALLDAFYGLIRSPADAPVPVPLQGFAAIAVVRAFPSRVTCATLPWDALASALSLS